MIDEINFEMGYLRAFLLIVCSFFCLQSFGQIDTTLQKSSSYILPASLLATGVIINQSNTKQTLQSDFFMTDTHLDDYLMYVPLVTLALAQVSGVKAQNHWFDQLKYITLAQLTSTVIVQGMKRSLKIKRPDGGNYAFPSGHASFAFVNAEILHQELKSEHSLLAHSGYLSATATSILRVSNQRHWVPDIVFGAGLGIVIGKLIYMWKPFKNFNPFKEEHEISLIIGHNGLGLQYHF